MGVLLGCVGAPSLFKRLIFSFAQLLNKAKLRGKASLQGAKAKEFLSDARQSEMRPFPFNIP